MDNKTLEDDIINDNWLIMELIRDDNARYYYTNLFAYYIYLHRKNCGRDGNRDDDFCKAGYLYDLYLFLKKKNINHYSIENNNYEREELIDMVNNIFDRAYFLKLEHSEYSDLQCFTEAERNFCEEKELDYRAYFKYLDRIKNGKHGDEITDFECAKAELIQNKINSLEYKKFLDRYCTDNKDNKNDIKKQLEHYYKYKFIKKTAEICWLRSPNKRLTKEIYWKAAENILEELNKNGIYYNDIKSFYEYQILAVIDNFLIKE